MVRRLPRCRRGSGYTRHAAPCPGGCSRRGDLSLQHGPTGSAADLGRSPDYNPLNAARYVSEQVLTFMRAHLHLLGILQLVWGAIGLLLGISMLLLAVGAVAIGAGSGSDRMAAGVIAAAFTIFAAALLLGGGANAWAGRELRRNHPRGRSAVLWLGALNLFVLPFGTALGIYAFWVLLHNQTRAVFVARS